MEKEKFNEIFRQRTKQLSVRIIKMYAKLPKTDELIIVGKQLIRSSTSVAANYRAACRARSKADFFAKMSIVVEEADETLFWLEILEETEMVQATKLTELKKETLELLSVFAKARNNIT
ncbi:four helix bundle protein [Rhodocytophaga rosea]|uniref:Four helix bundle protein n=1 Tax=Rhodocytophaga rosea TaxID=2704465 RepID=A0A6C0GIB2_9BACT|nr:four helix bundle protein [Rhodocytophaga rosea]QHT67791.1 four helix bundle protein [Rhodocytophaga rosea]